jgi:hypothetical protein
MLVTRAGPLLSQVRLDQLRPLGRLGEPAYLAYGRLAAALEGMGAADCARYFARPEPDARGETLSWHAMAEGGPVRSWTSLSAEEQRAAAPRLLAITQRLSEICARREAADPNDGLARLLRNAAVSPGMEHLYLVGDHPVLTGWGFEASGSRFDTLRFALPPSIEPERIPVVPAARSWEWPAGWWWLPLALLLLLALGWMLLAWWPDRAAPTVVAERVPQREAAATVSGPPAPARVTERPIVHSGADPATPAQPSARSGEVLSIPERGVDFLEGAWRTESALVDRRDHKPVVQTFTFDRNGWGEVVTRRSNGVECRGRARAERTPKGGLVIHGIELARCTDGNAFVPFRLECESGADRVSTCRGVNSDDGSEYAVVVRRL